MNTSTRPRKWQALRLLIIVAAGGLVASGAACSDSGSSTGTAGSSGGGTGGSAGTTGTGGTTGTAGTSGGFVNPGQCGERGTATVNATTYDGFTDFFIVGEAGLGTDVCVVRFTAKKAASGTVAAGCPDCNWSHLVELTNGTVMVNENGACDANDAVPPINAAGRAALNGNKSSRGFSLTSGHGDALLKYSDTMKMWIGVGRANWDQGANMLSYNISNGNCMYGH